LFSVVPVVGVDLVYWLWGGFSVNNATLNRFFVLHFFLPFLIAGISLVHIAALHQKGANCPLGINHSTDKISLYPKLVYKDRVGLIGLVIILSLLTWFAPNLLAHPDNSIPANSLVTPLSITPEWYFLAIYCILRSIPNKTGGVLAIALVFVALLALPFISTSPVRSSNFRPLHRKAFYLFISACSILTWAGARPVEEPYILIGQISAFYFFSYLLILVPILGRLEYMLLMWKKDKELIRNEVPETYDEMYVELFVQRMKDKAEYKRLCERSLAWKTFWKTFYFYN
jgi:ubiquinol-cytochrome c reductase cytochrome b subunit